MRLKTHLTPVKPRFRIVRSEIYGYAFVMLNHEAVDWWMDSGNCVKIEVDWSPYGLPNVYTVALVRVKDWRAGR